MDVRLYVGNLSYNTSDEDLRTLFAQAGTVSSATVVKDRDTNRSRGFAFVEMATQVEAQKAISMFNGYMLDNRALTVNLARPREERGGGGSGGSFDKRGGGGSKSGGSRRGQRGGTRRY